MSRNKSATEKKIEKAIGIGEDLKDLDNEMSDADEKIKTECRQKLVKELAEKMKKAKDFDDNKFTKEVFREIAEIGLGVSRVLQEEVQLTGEGRTAECLSSLLNSVTTAVKELHGMEVDAKKLELEKEKIDLKKTKQDNTSVGKLTQNNIYITTADLIRQIKKEEKGIIDIDTKKD